MMESSRLTEKPEMTNQESETADNSPSKAEMAEERQKGRRPTITLKEVEAARDVCKG